MEAHLRRTALLAVIVLSCGATFKTPNFHVEAATPQIARQVGEAAEAYRKDLAIEWLGEALPRWSEPCPITVKVGPNLGAGGVTTFLFDRGHVYGWRMKIQGSLERVLDSVLPHEVTHTLFASHFRQPLPRWADEGACTTVEHESEQTKQQRMLIDFLKTGRGIPFSSMFAMKEYPADIMPLYSQGYSLATFLIDRGGKQKFLEYIAAGLKREQWGPVTAEHYAFDNLAVLQDAWLTWVKQGSPRSGSGQDQSTPARTPVVLAASERRPRPEPNLIYRGQSEDPGPLQQGKLVPVQRDAPLAPFSTTRQSNTALSTYPTDSSLPGWQPSKAAIANQPSPAPASSPARVLLEWNRESAAPHPSRRDILDSAVGNSQRSMR